MRNVDDVLNISPEFDSKSFFKLFNFVFIFSLVYFFPLISGDLYFFTDYAKSIEGHASWQNAGTPFANFLLSLFSFQLNSNSINEASIVDSGPFLQIISILFLSLSIALFCTVLFKNRAKFYYAVAAFSIIANPFILNGMISRFECIIYSFAISLSLVASLNIKTKAKNLILGSLLLVTALATYQPAINLFIGASLLLFLVNFNSDRSQAYSILKNNSFKLCIGTLSYKLIVLDQIKSFSDHDYNFNLFPRVFGHSIDILINLAGILSESKVLIYFILYSIIVYAIFFIKSSDNKVESLLVFLLCLTGIIFSVTASYIILGIPLIQAKSFLGFSSLLLFAFLGFLKTTPQQLPYSKAIILIPSFYLLFQAYSFTAVHKGSADFTRNLGHSIKNRLEELDINSNTKVGLKLERQSYLSPAVKNTLNHEDKLLKYLVQNDYVFSKQQPTIEYLKFLGLKTKIYPSQNIENFNELQFENSYFKILKMQNHYLVILKSKIQ